MLLALLTPVCSIEKELSSGCMTSHIIYLIAATLFLLESDAFHAYKDAIGASLDNITGFLTIHPVQFDQLKDLTFTISGVCI